MDSQRPSFLTEYSEDGFDWLPGSYFDTYWTAQRHARESSQSGKQMWRVWNVEMNSLMITYRKGMSIAKPMKPEDHSWW